MIFAAAPTVAAYSLAAYLSATELLDATSSPTARARVVGGDALGRSYVGSPSWDFAFPWQVVARASTVLSDITPLVVGPERFEDALIAQLFAFRDLGEAWDGENAAPPTLAAVDDAVRFLRAAGDLAACLEPTLHVDGSVILEIGDGAEGSLRLKGDGAVIYATDKAGVGVAAFDGHTIPDELRSALGA